MYKRMTMAEAIEECIRIRDEQKYSDDSYEVILRKQEALELLINYAEDGEERKRNG